MSPSQAVAAESSLRQRLIICGTGNKPSDLMRPLRCEAGYTGQDQVRTPKRVGVPSLIL